MKISRLEYDDKLYIQSWKYTDKYSKFNYALKQDGWLKYCGNRSLCFKVVKDNDIVGVFFFIIENSNEFRILINPKYLNQGFGKKIVFKALKMAYNDLKLNEVSLIVRKNHQVAINLYSKFGFVIIGEEQQIIDNSNIDFFKMKHRYYP